MFSVIRKLNQDKDRCVLLGRNAFNFLLMKMGREGHSISTFDFDVLCPNLKIAEECKSLLEENGFAADGATFRGKKGELDILLADSDYPQCVIGNYYNIPSLRSLWDARKRMDGILAPPQELLLLNKLLYSRENNGKDAETITQYLRFCPEQFTPLLRTIETHPVREEREKLLYALYESVAANPNQREAVEKRIIMDINTKECAEIVEPTANEANVKASSSNSYKAAILCAQAVNPGMGIDSPQDGIEYAGKIIAVEGDLPDKWAVQAIADDRVVIHSVSDTTQENTLLSDKELVIVSQNGVIDSINEAEKLDLDIEEYER